MTARKIPRVSIGVAVYNGERFLSQTIDSLLAQTYSDFELIICDNSSTDRTEQICQSYVGRDPRIRYYRNAENIGAARNFNRTFSLSCGEYFKWSGADDLCAPEMIERCVAVLEARPEVVLAYTRTRLIDEHGAAVSDYDDRLNLQFETPHKRLSHLLWNIRMCNALFGLIRASTLRDIHLFGTYSNSDLAFLADLALQGQFVELPARMFFRRSFELSAVKYRSPYERMVVLQPGRIGQLSFPNWRLFFGFLSAIHRAPVSWGESLRCYARMYVWLRRWRDGLSEDVAAACHYFMRVLFRVRSHTQKETLP